MSIRNWFKAFFSDEEPSRTPTPPVRMQGHPPVINPTVDQKKLRYAGRLERLYLALEQGGHRPEDTQAVHDEIALHHQLLIAHGHKAPVNAREAAALYKQLQEGK